MKLSKSTPLLLVLVRNDIAYLIEGKNLIIADADYPLLLEALKKKDIKVQPIVEEAAKPAVKEKIHYHRPNAMTMKKKPIPTKYIKKAKPEMKPIEKPVKPKKSRERFKLEPEEPKQPFVRIKGVYSNPDYSTMYPTD